ncbi:hypothetical protein HID58_078283 [Brassica napus]|uniref:Uncharacterized protein n=1 Tax=Brassica napus TaxID=3708 RepID=A0ABQ7YSW9_BRANA|nr:hypothetical protein HID58_078283 [Brassica napus]
MVIKEVSIIIKSEAREREKKHEPRFRSPSPPHHQDPPPLLPSPLPPPPPLLLHSLRRNPHPHRRRPPYPDDRDGPGNGTRDAIVTVKSGRDDDGEEGHEAKVADAHHEHIKVMRLRGSLDPPSSQQGTTDAWKQWGLSGFVQRSVFFKLIVKLNVWEKDRVHYFLSTMPYTKMRSCESNRMVRLR